MKKIQIESFKNGIHPVIPVKIYKYIFFFKKQKQKQTPPVITMENFSNVKVFKQ